MAAGPKEEGLAMKKGLFTEDELSYLRSLDAVERAEPLRITPKEYTATLAA